MEEVDELAVGHLRHDVEHDECHTVVHPMEENAGEDGARAVIHPAEKQADEEGVDALWHIEMDEAEDSCRDCDSHPVPFLFHHAEELAQNSTAENNLFSEGCEDADDDIS